MKVDELTNFKTFSGNYFGHGRGHGLYPGLVAMYFFIRHIMIGLTSSKFGCRNVQPIRTVLILNFICSVLEA